MLDHETGNRSFQPSPLSSTSSITPFQQLKTEKIYDPSVIRQLLIEAFNPTEIEALCFDEFREVYQEFVPQMTNSMRIQRLIDYCDRHNLYGQLLTIVEKKNPSQYSIHASKLLKPSYEVSKPDFSKKVQVQLKLDFDLSSFQSVVQYTIVSAVAIILRIPRDQIQVIDVGRGSILLKLEMPRKSARQLLALHHEHSSELEDLRITDVVILGNSFDPYPLLLTFLSVLAAIPSFTNYSSERQDVEKTKQLRKQINRLAYVLKEAGSVLTDFRNILKKSGALSKDFRLGSMQIFLEKEDLVKIEQAYKTIQQVDRVLARTLNNLTPYLNSGEQSKVELAMMNVESWLAGAVQARDYQQFFDDVKNALDQIFDFALELGKTHIINEDEFAKVFPSLNLFGDWKNGVTHRKQSDENVLQIPIVSSLTADPIMNYKEEVEENLDLILALRVQDIDLKGDGIFPGDVVLVRRQPTVKQGEIAAVLIKTPIYKLGVLRKFYVFPANREDMRHWLLESSNPSSKHIVVVPTGANVTAIQNFYTRKLKEGEIAYYIDAEIAIVGKYVGKLKSTQYAL